MSCGVNLSNLTTVMAKKTREFYGEVQSVVSASKKSMDFNTVNLDSLFKKQVFTCLKIRS